MGINPYSRRSYWFYRWEHWSRDTTVLLARSFFQRCEVLNKLAQCARTTSQYHLSEWTAGVYPCYQSSLRVVESFWNRIISSFKINWSSKRVYMFNFLNKLGPTVYPPFPMSLASIASLNAWTTSRYFNLPSQYYALNGLADHWQPTVAAAGGEWFSPDFSS